MNLNEACRVFKKGKWDLYVFFNNRGTKMEGQFGVLVEDGNMVGPAEKGAQMDTELGKMKYYGLEKAQPWDTTGWHFADKSPIELIKSSST